MTISFIIEERQIDVLHNNEFSEKWFDYRIVRPELTEDLRENKPHTYPIIQVNGCVLNGWALIQACKAAGITTILCRVINEAIPDNELPDLVVSLNNQRNKKSWEQCEIALHFLPTESQQGKSNGGKTKWDIARERAGVSVSGDTIKEYFLVKEFVAAHPESKLLEKIKSHSLNALSIRTAYRNKVQKENQEEAQQREDEKQKRKAEEEAKRKEQEKKSEINVEGGNPDTNTKPEDTDIANDEEPPKDQSKLVLSDQIQVADPSHFSTDNINLWLQDNRQPWILKSDQQQIMNELIRLTVISLPYFNQRNYKKLGLYKPQTLPEYLQDLYESMENVKKHSHKNGVIAMNIGDTYKWGKNYNVICRVINRLCDELGLVFMFKQVWHKPYGYNKGDSRLMPLYNYEEIIYFCCSNERPQFNPFGYGDLDKELDVYMTGGRRNPDGTRTEPRMTTHNFYKPFHQSIDQQDFFDTITSVGTDGEHQKLKNATGIDHPALMPMVIPLYPILCFSKPGDIVMDCYSGTATTLCTSFLLGRKAWGIEQEEEYFMGSIDRLKSICQHFNSQEAEEIEQKFCQKFYSDALKMETVFNENFDEKMAS